MTFFLFLVETAFYSRVFNRRLILSRFQTSMNAAVKRMACSSVWYERLFQIILMPLLPHSAADELTAWRVGLVSIAFERKPAGEQLEWPKA